MTLSDQVISIYAKLSEEMDLLIPDIPVLAYNVLSYAGCNHEEYLRIAVRGEGRVVMLGMNPGPYGMTQTGVPFGAVSFVRSYLGITGDVGKPVNESSLCPVRGMAVSRDEASGRAVWTMASRYGSRDEFFSKCVVLNYCPLVFFDGRGRNLTPDKLPRGIRERIEARCSQALADIFDTLRPSSVIALGRYAEAKARMTGISVHYFPHPSPLNPSSGRFWKDDALTLFRRIADGC